MAHTRECRSCGREFLHSKPGRPPSCCPVCVIAGRSERESEPEWARELRDRVRARAGDALEDDGHTLHIGRTA